MQKNISKNKVWQIVGISVLCAVLVLGAVLGVVFGMHHSTEDLNVSKDMSSEDIVVSATEENGIMLTSGVATTAADGTTTKELTATVTPSDTSSLSYAWSVAFKDASSEWATGKIVTDYVTVTQDSSNKFKATVTFKKHFSEQIIVTIACVVKPSVKATATVECYKKVIGCNFRAVNESDSSNIVTWSLGNQGGTGYFTASSYETTITYTYGDGTLQPTIKWEMRCNDGWNSIYGSEGSTIMDTIPYYGEFGSSYDYWISQNMLNLRVLVNGSTLAEIENDFYMTPNSLSLDNTAIIF